MILQGIRLENFTAFHELDWQGLGNLNVIVGMNDNGKTHLLKVIYSFCRALSFVNSAKFRVGKTLEELNNKLIDNFMLETPDIISPGFISMEGWIKTVFRYNSKECNVVFNGVEDKVITFNFEKNDSIDIPTFILGNDKIDYIKTVHEKSITSIFIPAKEVLTLWDSIVESREGQKQLSTFDDTYYDLLKSCRLPDAVNLPSQVLGKCLPSHYNLMGGGKIEFNNEQLSFVRGEERYSMHQTAEGIKKVAVLERLIRNHSILPDGQTVLCIDEPETNLHPQAIIAFADLLHALAHEAKVQIFVATHSYYLMKRLEQLARRDHDKPGDTILLDLCRNSETQRIESESYNMKDGVSHSPFYAQNRQLFETDVALDMGETFQ